MILVVEDDPLVAGITCRMLQEAGLESRHVGTAREAIVLVETKGFLPELLLLDIRLPDMTGLRLAGRLASRLPAVPVLFMTGYPEAYAELARDGRWGFLAKPFQYAQLTAAVRRLLPQRTSTPRTAS
ncbi:MAG TPA: response regulator [Gemmatimonadales bacterium]|jgi:DNA-binding NtrC family response regulator